MTINERIKYIIDNYFNGNASAFARSMNIPQATVKDIIGGKLSKPGYEILDKILSDESLNINPLWLMRDKGNTINIGDNSIGNIAGNNISGGQVVNIPNFNGEKIISPDGKVELCGSAQSKIEKLEIENNALKNEIALLRDMVNMKDKFILMLEEKLKLNTDEPKE